MVLNINKERNFNNLDVKKSQKKATIRYECLKKAEANFRKKSTDKIKKPTARKKAKFVQFGF